MKIEEIAIQKDACVVTINSGTKREWTKCTDNCRYCGPKGCYLCDKGFAKDKGMCKKCPENCNRCNSKGCYHWGCALGFVYNNGQCKKCEDNCSVCFGIFGCRRYNTGFFLDKNRKCVNCKEPCSAKRCYKCLLDTKMEEMDASNKCPQNCRKCNHRGCYSFGYDKGFGITQDYNVKHVPIIAMLVTEML